MNLDAAPFKRPFRLGRKQKRAIVDSNGRLLHLFSTEKEALQELEYLNSPLNSVGIVKTVTGCNDCPFYKWHDAGCGGDCRLVPISQDVFKEMEHDEYGFNPVTPEWCPLKSEFVLVEFKK